MWGALTRSGVWSRVSSVESGARLADLEELLLFWSLCYLALRRVLQLVLLRSRSQGFKELEIVVLRHELSVLRRQVRRSQLRSSDRVFLAQARCGQRDRRSLRGVSSERCRSPPCISVRMGTVNSRPFAASRYSKGGGSSLLRRGAANGKRTPK